MLKIHKGQEERRFIIVFSLFLYMFKIFPNIKFKKVNPDLKTDIFNILREKLK